MHPGEPLPHINPKQFERVIEYTGAKAVKPEVVIVHLTFIVGEKLVIVFQNV
jgi:hypothetical protein